METAGRLSKRMCSRNGGLFPLSPKVLVEDSGEISQELEGFDDK